MRVAVVYSTDFAAISPGGIQRFVWLMGAVAPADLEISYFGVGQPDHLPRTTDTWVPVLDRSPRRGPLNVRFSYALRHFEADLASFDAVVVHRPEHLLAFRNRSTVCVLHGATLNAWRFGRRLKGVAVVGAETYAAWRARALISVDVGGLLRPLQRLAAGRLHATRVPLDPLFDTDAEPPDNRRLLYVGRLEPEKRVELLIELSSTSDWPLTVIGAGSQSRKLEDYARSLRAPVTFLGALATEDIVAQYKDGGTFVNASIAEGYPLACVEAMASGLRAAALDSRGIGQLAPYGLTRFKTINEMRGGLGGLKRPDVAKIVRDHSTEVVAEKFWSIVESASTRRP